MKAHVNDTKEWMLAFSIGCYSFVKTKSSVKIELLG